MGQNEAIIVVKGQSVETTSFFKKSDRVSRLYPRSRVCSVVLNLSLRLCRREI